MFFLPKSLLKTSLLCLLIFSASYLLSTWFKIVLNKNFIIALAFLLITVAASLYSYRKTTVFLMLLLATFTLLLYLQLSTTNFKNEYEVTATQIDLQITRMNYYPARLARLGYILENKSEVKVVQKMEQNFFETIDFRGYFPDYFSIFAFPLFLAGLLLFFEKKYKLITVMFLFCIVLLTLIGVHGKFGPFIIFPFIMLSVFTALVKIFGLDKEA